MNKNLKLLIFSIIIFSFPFLAKAQPAAISDLQCVFAQTTGAVWLTWTAPVGAVSYDVRYFPGAIGASDYNLAWQFSQNWSGTAQQGLVINLTGNETWFFAIKSIDVSDNYSNISNVVYCFVPTVVVQTDKIVPTSLITDPKDGATILSNNDYIIKGDSSDTGGSSVKQVEVSFDQGKNWLKTEAMDGNKTNGFTWKFIWSKPALGDYQLITRATDWLSNIETPGTGIKARVAGQETPITEKPISEMNVIELKAKIAEIQQQIIQLLTQLIQLTQQQLLQIKR
jgi:hypothetical protein